MVLLCRAVVYVSHGEQAKEDAHTHELRSNRLIIVHTQTSTHMHRNKDNFRLAIKVCVCSLRSWKM
jgi:hypothetical protein